MFFKKFFDEGSGDGGGALEDKNQEGVHNPGEGVVTDPPPADKIEIPLSQLKAMGFESVDQMVQHFEKNKVEAKTEEEKQREQELENANFRSFAIAEGLMKEDDFKTYERVSATPDRDLVFNDFLNDFKADHPEIEEDQVSDAAKEAFNSEYRTASEKRIKKEADLIRKETTSGYQKAREEYDDDRKWKGGVDKWTKFVASTIEEALPGENLDFYIGKDGEDEVKVAVPLTKEEKAEIAKQVLTPKRYAQFLDGKEEDVKKIIQERVVAAAKQKYQQDAIKIGIQRGIEIGKTRGSNVGAVNHFAIARQLEGQNQLPVDTDALKAVRDSYKGVNYEK